MLYHLVLNSIAMKLIIAKELIIVIIKLFILLSINKSLYDKTIL